MFCPVCKAEYREGFARCADCDVDLVSELPAGAIVSAEPVDPGDPEEDPFCSFWKGDDPRVHAELCELLGEQGIPHRTIRRQDHLFNWNTRSAFEIGVPFSMFDKAETAVKEAYGTEQGDETIQRASRLLPFDADHIPGTQFDSSRFNRGMRSSRQNSSASAELPAAECSEDASGPRESKAFDADWDAGSWSPEDALARIWSGDQPELAEFIAASLQTNQIQCRIDSSGGKRTLFVAPKDEQRGREIVREVVEGEPPE
jgi:hypothetical protein